MALYQILVPLVCLLFILKAFSHFLRKRKTFRELLGWILVWGGVAFIALFPDSTEFLAGKLGIKSNINAIIFVAFGILFYTVFRLVVAVDDLQYHLTLVVREDALRGIKAQHAAGRSGRRQTGRRKTRHK